MGNQLVLNRDNEWHEALLAKTRKGVFALYENTQAIEKEPEGMFGQAVEIMDVKVNWNNGQPIVDLLDGTQMNIVDIGNG